jgi:hypothetical protein
MRITKGVIMFWNLVRCICRYFFPRIYEGTYSEEDIAEYADMSPEIDSYIAYSKLVAADKRIRRIAHTRIKKWRNADWHNKRQLEHGRDKIYDWGTPRHIVAASIKMGEKDRWIKQEPDPEPFWEKEMDNALAKGQYEYGWKDYARTTSD